MPLSKRRLAELKKTVESGLLVIKELREEEEAYYGLDNSNTDEEIQATEDAKTKAEDALHQWAEDNLEHLLNQIQEFIDG